MGDYLKSTIESIGQTNVLAERIGWTAESFQKLAYAARFATTWIRTRSPLALVR